MRPRVGVSAGEPTTLLKTEGVAVSFSHSKFWTGAGLVILGVFAAGVYQLTSEGQSLAQALTKSALFAALLPVPIAILLWFELRRRASRMQRGSGDDTSGK